MSKNIAIFFDGTASRSHGARLSNVARLAMAVNRRNISLNPQIVIYHRGVGTGTGTFKRHRRVDTLLGGALGSGLDTILIDVYRQLVFAFEPGDEIYLFGWSRGAYAAWRFADMLAHFGVIAPKFVPEIPGIVQLELTDDRLGAVTARVTDFYSIRMDMAVAHPGSSKEALRSLKTGAPTKPVLSVRYLGMWDCVAAIGAPLGLNRLFKINRHLEAATPTLPWLIDSVRHAVALDEASIFFPPRLVSEPLERLRLEQLFFPGGHAAVGGVVEENAIGDLTMGWIAMGAHRAGLGVDLVGLGAFEQPDVTLKEARVRSPGLFSKPQWSKKRPFAPGWDELAQSAQSLIRRVPAYARKWPIAPPDA